MTAPDRVWAEVNALPVWRAPSTAPQRTPPIEIITERPRRLLSINNGKCPGCGDRFHGCGCRAEEASE